MNETIRLLLSLSLSGTILGILLFAIKPFIRYRLSKTIQYYIWIVVLLRLIIPFSFEDSIMNNLFYNNNSPQNINKQIIVDSFEGTTDNTIDSSGTPRAEENIIIGAYNNDVNHNRYFKDILNEAGLYIWLIGLIIALTVNLAGYVRFLKHLKKGYRPATDEENRILETLLDGRKNVKLLRNRFVPTPMLIGIMRPCIIIPDIDFSKKQLKNILLHEISHLRHFDIGIKWMTMIAASIHWYNPFMYFIKKEINNACELACDEAVIKNLSSAEKQAYGETLISVIAENRYSTSVLGATMCEEKKTLKERLVAIMKHNKKSKTIMVVSIILLGLIIYGGLYLGAGIGKKENIPPNIYINIEGEEIKNAMVGSYSWENDGEHIQADSDHPIKFQYKSNNIVSASRKDKLIIDTQKLKEDKKYDFEVEEIDVYKDGKLIKFEDIESNFMDGELYINTPHDPGEYIYVLRLNFKDKGTVSYGFVVRVDMLSYDLEEISKYKTPYVGDNSKVSNIASLLPVPNRYFTQRYISMETGNKPYGLTIYYELASDKKYKGKWPITSSNSIVEMNSRKNALVVFSMIDNLDKVTFTFRNSKSEGELEESKYNTAFTFQRSTFEKEYGDLSELVDNLALLEDALTKKVIVKESEIDYFDISKEIKLGNFSYNGTDDVEKLVYDTEIEKHKTSREGFTIIAPHIFGSYEEDNKLKVFVTTFSSHYRLYGKVLSQEGGSVIPAAITYVKNSDGKYSLEEYKEAMDGSDFASSIKEFCTMPVSGKEIKDLADKILDHYGDYEDIMKLERKNLIKHLKANNQYGISLYQEHYKEPVELIPLT
ncbi:M56 family metallopeptidase [Maledivibacter halophilus]|uniref:Signal transducer regulating beta-lactamase production, contains metallopeptidase domain n=1 Tax=Maledivibacter halophilus TaxID=36842 RepID=A0A1T5M878_9FIRM|nr:M56 family metallopeptidase [Maledivibacter halophilus]SKC84345.1 Signal transducer regulating beta-lactamase production, contains metallopeptidase domain [Maledivibacter halophilus]